MIRLALHCKTPIGTYVDSLYELLLYIRNCKDISSVSVSKILFHQVEEKYLLEGYSIFENSIPKENEFDFLISLGGDGTLLESTTFSPTQKIPIVCINFGKLGFLSQITSDKFRYVFECLLSQRYEIEERMLLEIDSPTHYFDKLNFALNEFVVSKKDTSSMLRINTFIGDVFLNTYWADGLMVSTPTGSTGYSLSVGGPIMMPDLDNFIVAPICPHNLNARPLVISKNNKIKIHISHETPSFLASLDHRSMSIPNSEDLFFVIKNYNYKAKLVKFENNNFFHTLRNKLFWGKDARN